MKAAQETLETKAQRSMGERFSVCLHLIRINKCEEMELDREDAISGTRLRPWARPVQTLQVSL